MNEPLDPGIETELEDRLTYGRYLALERLLDCQQPVSDSHDEMLFMVIHQASELWMKAMIHELDAARRRIRAGDLRPAFKMLARVARIQAQMIQSWDVLSTLTPADYLAFRDRLGPASGFQSYQYRLIEFMLGHRHAGMLAVHRHTPKVHARLAAELARPCLYDEVIRLLARRGFAIAAECRERDWSRAYTAHPSVRAAWAVIYLDPERRWDLYELAEELVDLEDWLRQWRFRHLTTVERIIGRKPGTGGSSGVGYLERALEGAYFPELWQVRNDL